MAERNGPVIVDIMNLLETEPDSSSSMITTGTPHPNFRRAAHTGAGETIERQRCWKVHQKVRDLLSGC